MEKKTYHTQIKKNTKNLAIYTALWTISMAVATFGPKFIWGENKTLTFLGVLLNAIFGVFMILANIKHLKSQDELQKKIQLEGMAYFIFVYRIRILRHWWIRLWHTEVSKGCRFENTILMRSPTKWYM